MIHAAIADYIVSMAENVPEHYGRHAQLVEEFDLERTERNAFYLEVWRQAGGPVLCVAQRYYPDHWAGSFPGILLIPETDVLFIGAGERLLAYDLRGPTRLWEDNTAWAGFQSWRRHGDVVVMSAELALVAWGIRGEKLWGTDVEPPWGYVAQGEEINVDVMGAESTFPLLTGPARHGWWLKFETGGSTQ